VNIKIDGADNKTVYFIFRSIKMFPYQYMVMFMILLFCILLVYARN